MSESQARLEPRAIALVTSSYPSAASDYAGHFVAREVRELVRAGNQVTVLAPGSPPRKPVVDGACHYYLGGDTAFGPPGVWFKLRERPTRLFSVLSFIFKARRLLGNLGPWDLIICHWLVPAGFPLSFRLRAEREWVAHGSDVRLLGSLPKWLARLALHEVGDGCRLRFVSHELKQVFDEHFGLEVAAKSSIRACPIDVSQAPTRGEARRLLGIADRSRIALVVGRLVKTKRVDVALQALGAVPDFEVVVVGGGPCLEALAREYVQARFVGEVDHARALTWMRAADVLVSASRLEGAPTALREARALGLAVVHLPTTAASAIAPVSAVVRASTPAVPRTGGAASASERAIDIAELEAQLFSHVARLVPRQGLTVDIG